MNDFPFPLEIQFPNQSPFNPPSCKTVLFVFSFKKALRATAQKGKNCSQKLKVIQLDKENTTEQTEITPDISSTLVARKL